jgi:L-threonylcarbamoyladenylate synthase
MPSCMEIIPIEHPRAIERAIAVLDRGGLIVFPTDTVYGLAARVDNVNGIKRLYQVKERAPSKAIAVLLGDFSQLPLLTISLSPNAEKLIQAFWPGALTVVVERHPDLPAVLSPSSTIGLRMPNHPFARTLLSKTGPLATTSANISGQSDTLSIPDVLAQLVKRIDLLLDGGTVPLGQSSTVVDCTQDPPVILRQGPISMEQIHRVLMT